MFAKLVKITIYVKIVCQFGQTIPEIPIRLPQFPDDNLRISRSEGVSTVAASVQYSSMGGRILSTNQLISFGLRRCPPNAVAERNITMIVPIGYMYPCPNASYVRHDERLTQTRLPLNQNLPSYILDAKKSKNLGPWRQRWAPSCATAVRYLQQ